MKEFGNLNLTQSQHTILSSLRHHERFGLEILDAMEHGGEKRIGFNTLYPNLKKLEQMGLVRSRWDDTPAKERGARRKYFTITGLGEEVLRDKEERLSLIARWQPKPN